MLQSVFQSHGACWLSHGIMPMITGLSITLHAHDQKFIRYAQSLSLQRVLRRYGFSDRFSIKRVK